MPAPAEASFEEVRAWLNKKRTLRSVTAYMVAIVLFLVVADLFYITIPIRQYLYSLAIEFGIFDQPQSAQFVSPAESPAYVYLVAFTCIVCLLVRCLLKFSDPVSDPIYLQNAHSNPLLAQTKFTYPFPELKIYSRAVPSNLMAEMCQQCSHSKSSRCGNSLSGDDSDRKHAWNLVVDIIPSDVIQSIYSLCHSARFLFYIRISALLIFIGSSLASLTYLITNSGSGQVSLISNVMTIGVVLISLCIYVIFGAAFHLNSNETVGYWGNLRDRVQRAMKNQDFESAFIIKICGAKNSPFTFSESEHNSDSSRFLNFLPSITSSIICQLLVNKLKYQVLSRSLTKPQRYKQLYIEDIATTVTDLYRDVHVIPGNCSVQAQVLFLDYNKTATQIGSERKLDLVNGRLFDHIVSICNSSQSYWPKRREEAVIAGEKYIFTWAPLEVDRDAFSAYATEIHNGEQDVKNDSLPSKGVFCIVVGGDFEFVIDDEFDKEILEPFAKLVELEMSQRHVEQLALGNPPRSHHSETIDSETIEESEKEILENLKFRKRIAVENLDDRKRKSPDRGAMDYVNGVEPLSETANRISEQIEKTGSVVGVKTAIQGNFNAKDKSKINDYNDSDIDFEESKFSPE